MLKLCLLFTFSTSSVVTEATQQRNTLTILDVIEMIKRKSKVKYASTSETIEIFN